MLLLESIRLALQQIRAQKLKSFFSILGVTIGVMFLISVVSIVEGMSRYMEEDFVGKLMGVNTFEVRRFPSINIGNTTEEQWREWQRRPYVRDSDVQPIVASLPPDTKWSAQNSAWNVYLESRYARPRQSQVYMVDGDYFRIKRMDIASGRIISEPEFQQGTKVAVIGEEVRRHFFPNIDPLGRDIQIGGQQYRVIGVADKQGSVFGFSLDKFVVVPLHSPARRINTHLARDVVGTLMIQSSTAEQMRDAMEEVRAVMRGRHKLRPSQPDDFDLSTSESALAFWQEIKGVMQFAGAALPAIGLIIGARVIMNIMLVAVAERTREIGIRKALGARRGDIVRQFLAESATLSTVGAAIGVALGLSLAFVIDATTSLPAAVAPWSIGVGVVLGTVVGILAGLYPASRAARLDPIAAIRQE
jgi:putative ABC transport system permease protein